MVKHLVNETRRKRNRKKTKRKRTTKKKKRTAKRGGKKKIRNRKAKRHEHLAHNVLGDMCEPSLLWVWLCLLISACWFLLKRGSSPCWLSRDCGDFTIGRNDRETGIYLLSLNENAIRAS